MTAAESLAAMDREKAYAIAYADRFHNALILGWSDVASAVEDCSRMRVGENPSSFLAQNLMDREHEGIFIPLVQSMTMDCAR
jgi:hypothetical protein